MGCHVTFLNQSLWMTHQKVIRTELWWISSDKCETLGYPWRSKAVEKHPVIYRRPLWRTRIDDTHSVAWLLLKECTLEHCEVQYPHITTFPLLWNYTSSFPIAFWQTRRKQATAAGSGSKETANLTATLFSLMHSVVGFAANAHSSCTKPELLRLLQPCSFPTTTGPQILVEAHSVSVRLFKVIWA